MVNEFQTGFVSSYFPNIERINYAILIFRALQDSLKTKKAKMVFLLLIYTHTNTYKHMHTHTNVLQMTNKRECNNYPKQRQ